MYFYLDKLFLIVHTAIIVFNLLGWVWKPTRKYNLALLLLTAFSWIILGIWYGWGYCPLTEWHWNILEKIDVKDLPDSYITYLLERILHLKVDTSIVEKATVIGFIFAITFSIIFNIKDYQKYRKSI